MFATFLTSAFLHGNQFQVWAVLLSLGIFTYVEDRIRYKLAIRYNASICARLKRDDSFKYGETSFWILAINLLFSLLSIVHLAYLGAVFNQFVEPDEEPHWTDTIETWRDLGFFSHLFFLAVYLISFAI